MTLDLEQQLLMATLRGNAMKVRLIRASISAQKFIAEQQKLKDLAIKQEAK
jgi:hypothetical protein